MRNLMIATDARFNQAAPVDMMSRAPSTASTVRRILDESRARADYKARMTRQGMIRTMITGAVIGFALAGLAMAAGIL